MLPLSCLCMDMPSKPHSSHATPDVVVFSIAERKREKSSVSLLIKGLLIPLILLHFPSICLFFCVFVNNWSTGCVPSTSYYNFGDKTLY